MTWKDWSLIRIVWPRPLFEENNFFFKSGPITTTLLADFMSWLEINLPCDISKLLTGRKLGVIPETEISSAKYFSSEMVSKVADRALQIMGGAGYMEDNAITRLYRDTRLFRLYEGTSQIQQRNIARKLIKK